MNDELYAEHPAMFKNHPFIFILALLFFPAGIAMIVMLKGHEDFGQAAAVVGMIFIVIGFLVFLWMYLRTKSSKLTIKDDEIWFEQGLLSKEHAEINISSVRTVKVKQSFTDRIFGIGTIEIFTSGDEPEILTSGMPDPNKVREIIKMNQGQEDS